MNKILRKITVFAAAAMLTISSVATFTTSATKPDENDPGTIPNFHDTYWYGSHRFTRRKTNDTSLYINNTSDYYVSVSVYGAKTSDDGSIYYDVSSAPGYGSVQTLNVVIPAHAERFVKQFIKEKGMDLASVWFKESGTYGYWSPDSVGNYPYAN